MASFTVDEIEFIRSRGNEVSDLLTTEFISVIFHRNIAFLFVQVLNFFKNSI